MRARLPRVVILLGITSLLTDISSEMILPLIPSMVAGLGGAPWIVGLIDGIADALSAVLKLVAGRMSDRMRTRKPFALAGYGLSTIVRPLVGLATSPWHIIAVRAADRVGKGVRSAPRDALIADSVAPADQPRAFAFHRMMDHTGAIVGPLVATALLAIGLSASQAIVWAWLPGVLAVIALAMVREPPLPFAHQASTPADGALPRELVVLLALVGVFALGALGDLFVLVRARELGVDERLLPVVWSVLHVAKVAAAWRIGSRDLAGARWVVVGWILVAAGIALLLVPSAPVVWGAAVVLGIGHGIREPVEKALVGSLAPAAQKGRAFGLYHLVGGLGALPAGLGIGLVWTAASGPAALAMSAAIVIGAALALAITGRSPTRGS